jgi:hypothetical protein
MPVTAMPGDFAVGDTSVGFGPIWTGQPRLRHRRDLEQYTSDALVQLYMLQIAD